MNRKLVSVENGNVLYRIILELSRRLGRVECAFQEYQFFFSSGQESREMPANTDSCTIKYKPGMLKRTKQKAPMLFFVKTFIFSSFVTVLWTSLSQDKEKYWLQNITGHYALQTRHKMSKGNINTFMLTINMKDDFQ